MKRNGYTALEMLVVYNEIVHLIERQAAIYGKTLNNLEEEGNLIITLNDLIEKGYYVADDSEGNVIDPRNSNATLNGLKIKMAYLENGNVTAEVIEEE